MSLFSFGNPGGGDSEVVDPQEAWLPDHSYLIAEPSIEHWINLGNGYCMSPARLRFTKKDSPNNRALEEIAKYMGVKFRNTSQDSMGRWFIGGDNDSGLAGNWEEFMKLNLYLGKKVPSIKEAREFMKVLFEGLNGKEIYTVGGERLKTEYMQKVLFDFSKTHTVAKTRSTFLEDYFDFSKGILTLKKNCIIKEGHLLPTYKKELDNNTLKQDRAPGISLQSFLKGGSTSQGLPSNNVEEGDLYYLAPRKDGNYVSAFESGNPYGSSLVCVAVPSIRDITVGCYSFGKIK